MSPTSPTWGLPPGHVSRGSVSFQLCFCLALDPVDPDPDPWVDFPGWAQTCLVTMGLPGDTWADPGYYHWTWSWPLFPAQPGACLFTMDLHSDRDPWLTLAAFFRPARLFSMWGRTSSIKVLALVSHLVHHLLESSWVFLLPNTTVWQAVTQLCTPLFDHCTCYWLLSTSKDKIKTEVLAVQTSRTRGEKHRCKIRWKLRWAVHLTSLKRQDDIKVKEKINKYQK